MNGYYVAGFCVGLLIVLIVFTLLNARNKNKKNDFDERQILARNSAYRSSFFTLLGYMALITLLDSIGLKWAEFGVQTILGILISTGVFCSICIFKDAYMSYNEKSMKSYILLFAVVIISNLLSFVMNVVIDGEMILTNGMLNDHSINLFLAILFAIFLILIIIKNMISKRTVEDEE